MSSCIARGSVFVEWVVLTVYWPFLCLQLWMMKGQIEEQEGKTTDARDAFNQGVIYINPWNCELFLIPWALVIKYSFSVCITLNHKFTRYMSKAVRRFQVMTRLPPFSPLSKQELVFYLHTNEYFFLV